MALLAEAGRIDLQTPGLRAAVEAQVVVSGTDRASVRVSADAYIETFQRELRQHLKEVSRGATGRWWLSTPDHRPVAGWDLREELAVEVLVEFQRYAAAVAVEDDRGRRPTEEAVSHAEIEGHLVALVRRDGPLEVAALGFAHDDDLAVPVVPEQDVGVAGKAVRKERLVRPMAGEIARYDADGGETEAPAGADAGRMLPASTDIERGRDDEEDDDRGGEDG